MPITRHLYYSGGGRGGLRADNRRDVTAALFLQQDG